MPATIDHDRSASAVYLVTLVHEAGETLEYTGAETLDVELWAGDDRAEVSGLSVAWDTAPDLVAVTVPQSATSGLDPGVYQCRVFVGPSGARVWVAEVWLNVLSGPASGTAPKVYATYDDLLRVAPWAGVNLAEADMQAGFAEQRREAREWLDAIIRARYDARRGSGWFSSELGPIEPGDTADEWLQDILDDDGLKLTEPDGARLKDACSHYAAAQIAGRQLMMTGDDTYYGRQAYHLRRASALVQSCIAYIDTDDDGTADLRLPLRGHRVR